MPRSLRLFSLLLALSGCASSQARHQSATDSEYLYVWTGTKDSTASDYLAVFNIHPDSNRYGSLVTTVPVGTGLNTPHHTEHNLAADRQLFANGFGSGKSFIFDLGDEARPRLAIQFADRAGFTHPHSFLRLPDGNVLGTFQMRHDSTGMHPGGLVEMTPTGEIVRSRSAEGPGVSDGLRPYSAAIVASLDRIVTSTTDMDPSSEYRANQVQIWRLSTLQLLYTITLPAGPLGDEGDLTAEPRLLSDGRTVMVSTFNCGLYLLDGIDGDQPAGRLVATFPRKEKTHCAIPVVAGSHWITTVPSYPAVVSLDISDPAHPREVSRMMLPEGNVPHWIAMEPNEGRVVITGYGTLANRVLLATFDSTTGALSLDQRFRPEGASQPGFDLVTVGLHGETAGFPHGAVFSLPSGSSPR
jgi:56kDa selenium binding protein (SBP56)